MAFYTKKFNFNNYWTEDVYCNLDEVLFKSDMPIYQLKNTWNYVYSPFWIRQWFVYCIETDLNVLSLNPIYLKYILNPRDKVSWTVQKKESTAHIFVSFLTLWPSYPFLTTFSSDKLYSKLAVCEALRIDCGAPIV